MTVDEGDADDADAVVFVVAGRRGAERGVMEEGSGPTNEPKGAAARRKEGQTRRESNRKKNRKEQRKWKEKHKGDEQTKEPKGAAERKQERKDGRKKWERKEEG